MKSKFSVERVSGGRHVRRGVLSLVVGCAAVLPAWAAECLIEPTQMVEVASAVPGLVSSVNVRRGDRVKKGQVLATLDDRAERAAMVVARYRATQTGPAELAARKIQFAQQRFHRREALAKERLIASQDSDDAEGELRVAESELKVAAENRELAKLELEQHSVQVSLRTVRSPIDGVVVEQMANPGESVEGGPGKKGIFKLAQIHPLRVHVILPKDQFGKVKVGDVVTVKAESPVSESLKATVKTVDRIINAASGTFVVWLELPNPDFRLPSGIRCNAELGGK
jgi:RND family efflux transporter MFP subunit